MTRSHLVGGGVARGCVALLFVLGMGGCGSKGGSPVATPDSGTPVDVPASVDVPVPVDVHVSIDEQGPDVQVTTDAGADDVQPPIMDAAMDAAVVECAPLPTGGPTSSGAAPMQDAGATVTSTPTRPELSDEVAEGRYTMLKALAQGGTMVVPPVPDGGAPGTGGTPTYALNDNWDPITNGIGDPATFTPMFTVAPDGSGTHPTISAAFAAAIFLAQCTRVYIRLMPGDYRERVLLNSKTSAPPITLYSTETDAKKTRIISDGSAATNGGMSNSATMTVKALSGFQMKNITIANDYVEGSATGDDQSGVALLVQTDKAQFENVHFLGNIATLYIKSLDVVTAARSYFRDCYVEGDQDFILGRGTAIFDHSEIKYLTGRQAVGGNVAYPSTLVYNRYGFLFESCRFTAETGASAVTFARQWQESTAVAAVGKMIVRNTTLGDHLAGPAPWSTTGARMVTPKDMAGTTPVLVYSSDDYYSAADAPVPPEPYLAEYRNSGPGAHQ